MKKVMLVMSILLVGGMASAVNTTTINGQTHTCPDGYSFQTTVIDGVTTVNCQAPSQVPATTPEVVRGNTAGATSRQLNELIRVLSRNETAGRNTSQLIQTLQRCDQLLNAQQVSSDVIQGTPITTDSQDNSVADLREQHDCAEGNNLIVVNGVATCVEGSFSGAFTTGETEL